MALGDQDPIVPRKQTEMNFYLFKKLNLMYSYAGEKFRSSIRLFLMLFLFGYLLVLLF
jgi:hypothetical protein